MASHPYISGAANITQMVGFLRKTFPANVTSDTVKKLGLASANESYVINALQFVGVIDAEGKRTEVGQSVMALHEEDKFKKAFSELVKAAYKDLFDLRGDDAWTLTKDELIGYFRSADKTSDVIGSRQAGVFQAFRGLAGYEGPTNAAKSIKATVGSTKAAKPKAAKIVAQTGKLLVNTSPVLEKPAKKDMALTVRIEINLPAEASAETYDNIFKSIKANLLNE